MRKLYRSVPLYKSHSHNERYICCWVTIFVDNIFMGSPGVSQKAPQSLQFFCQLYPDSHTYIVWQSYHGQFNPSALFKAIHQNRR